VVTELRAREEYWKALGEVLDPEVPVLSVTDLGIVRDVREENGTVVVDITPTYSGCPAMRVIEHDITEALCRAGARHVRVNTIFQPVWTTDWISPDARERLRAYGIAPPTGAAAVATGMIQLERRAAIVPCPRCGSRRTEQRSEFGSTACKALWFCNDCAEPFEFFKPI
jgi:ring-1,2-phenylacetyl-CoA epoxidase subunit PaaD